MRSLLLIVYLAGAIGMAWCLNASTASRERHPFSASVAFSGRSTSLDRLADALVLQVGYRFYGS